LKLATWTGVLTMKSLQPITILAVGPPLAGVAVSIVASILVPGVWTAPRILFWFVAGAILGAVIFAPIAAAEAEAFRARLIYLLGPHRHQIWWYVSISMTVAFGYMLAVPERGSSNGFFWLAVAVLFTDTMLTMALQILYERGSRSAE
jgi:hypothetical protein